MENLFEINGTPCQLDKKPESCPFCHKHIIPNFIYGARKDENYDLVFRCPNFECQKLFIANYAFYAAGLSHSSLQYVDSMFGNPIFKEFNDSINNVSPEFSSIYGEAYMAEQIGLKQICGTGYRKALEFLVKDYAIIKNPAKEDIIKKNQLAQVISDYVNDERIKAVARRAAWLGNDETHYVRKWESLDLDHLKKLIDLTVHWIEMEQLTGDFYDQMPD